MNVFVVQGEHPYMGGCPISVHLTAELAHAEAMKLLNIIRADLQMPEFPPDMTLDEALERLYETEDYDRDEFGVWITELPVELPAHETDALPTRPGWKLVEPARQNAEFWRKGAHATEDRGEAVLAMEQAHNAYKNAAYHLAEMLDKAKR
jgi:hypothetical protein